MQRPGIGKIVKSNSHVDYVCQIYGPGEVERMPAPDDYSFGAFVSIPLESPGNEAASLIGVIYNTLLLNPEYGNVGPRLSPRNEIEVFSPDYLSETATLVGIYAVGWLDDNGRIFQGVPRPSAAVNASVAPLRDDEIERFHRNARGDLALTYFPLLLGQNNPLASPLLLAILDRLSVLFPANRDRLAVLRNNLAWKAIVQPAG
ncbi:MAG: hypothetical protein IPK16_05795 [Anaerolineales bacterium]|nr:hypothetical protein [Anaerolineales bacterium]